MRQSSATEEANLNEMNNNSVQFYSFGFGENEAIEDLHDNENLNSSLSTPFQRMSTINTKLENNGRHVSNKKPLSKNSSGKSTPSFTADAMEEYIGLSIVVAKIKFPDVTISSSKIRQQMEKEGISM